MSLQSNNVIASFNLQFLTFTFLGGKDSKEKPRSFFVFLNIKDNTWPIFIFMGDGNYFDVKGVVIEKNQ